jgi:hypothetical protein
MSLKKGTLLLVHKSKTAGNLHVFLNFSLRPLAIAEDIDLEPGVEN